MNIALCHLQTLERQFLYREVFMEVFTVSFSRKCDFVGFLQGRQDIPIRGISEKTYGDNSRVEIYSDKCIQHELADVLTDYILGPYRKNLANRQMTENYPFISENEKNEIIKLLPYDKYADKIKKLVLKYTQNNNSMDIMGFVRFRIPEFERDALADVNHAADNFLATKEFEEMISLLKYHVMKSKSNGTVNIIFKSLDEFLITDSEQKSIDLSDFPCPEDTKKVDLIVGILVSIAPEKIIIHNDHLASPALISVLKTVFDDKITFNHGY